MVRFLSLLALLTVLAAAPAASALEPPTSAPASHPRLTTAPDGSVLLSWVEPRGKALELKVARLGSNGWSEPVTVHRGKGWVATWADPPTVLETAHGWFATWLVPAAKDSHGTFLVLARSDDGRRWSKAEPVHDDRSDTEHGFSTLLPGPDGVEIAWLDGRAYAEGGSATALRMRSLVPPGPERVLDERTCDCCPTAGLGDVLAWRDRIGGEIRDMSVASRDDDWAAQRATHDQWEFAGCPVNGPALARNAGDLLAWYTADEPVTVQAVLLGGWPRVPAAVATRDGVLGRVGAARLGAGWVVTWVQETEGVAQVLARTVGPQGTLGEVRVVGETSAKRSAGTPTIAAAGDRAVVVWQVEGPALRAAELTE